jgi:hypothetical protein
LEKQTWLLIRGQPLEEVGALIRAATVNGDTASPYYYTRFPVGLVEHQGNPLIWSNRTSAALGFGGIPRANWVVVDVTEYVESGHPGEAN